jgi:hypothetical protein
MISADENNPVSRMIHDLEKEEPFVSESLSGDETIVKEYKKFDQDRHEDIVKRGSRPDSSKI